MPKDAVSNISAAHLCAAMLAVFAATAGSSVFIPVLPFFLEQVQVGESLSTEWHVSFITGLYTFAEFMVAHRPKPMPVRRINPALLQTSRRY